MLERSPRHRRLVVTVALLAAAAAAAGGSASASRPRPPADDALARAVALQINAATSVVAEARGDQTSNVSGVSLTVPGVLELRTADSAARTRLGSDLRAQAETHLGHLHLQASTARIDQLVARVVAGTETRVSEVLGVACTLGIGVETEAVVAAAVHGVVLGAAGTPLALGLDGSLEAEIGTEVRAVLETEDLSGPACAGRIAHLAGRVVAAVERPVRAALDAHLSVSLTALRTQCDLGPRSAQASTELLVHRRTAALLGFDGEVDGDGVLVRVGPNTGVDLGGGVSVILNQQHRANRPGREAQITVHGAVVRIDGIVVATLASSHCQLWGDVTIDTGTGGSGLTVAPEVEAEVEVAAGVEAEVSVAAQTGAGGRLTSFAAGAYVRATRHF